MRVLTLEDMRAVSGGGSLDSTDHIGSRGGSRSSSGKSGGGSHTPDGHAKNSGWGARAGGLIGGAAGSYAGGAIAPGVGVAKALGAAAGKFAGSVIGHTVENGFVAGANAAIDKTLHDAQNARGRAAASGSRWGRRHH